MMRVTVKGVLLGGSVGVLITTAFLWTQCRPPVGKMGLATVPDLTLQGQYQEQHERRQPLMTRNHLPEGFSDVEDYTDALVAHSAPKLRSNVGSNNNNRLPSLDEEEPLDGDEDAVPMSEIACVINQETIISCRRDDADVFIPFSFIHNYFEVYGRVSVNDQGKDVFEWSHSYSNVFEPESAYQPVGTFLNFKSFNVEARDRVKCISATEGVPISTQWHSSGYTYPIQIAQYGLSHYSKYLEEPPSNKLVLENGLDGKAKLKYSAKTSIVGRNFNKDIGSYVLKFNTGTAPADKGVIMKVPDGISLDLNVLNIYFRLFPDTNSSIVVTLQTQDKKSDLFYLHYVCSNKLIKNKDQHTYYGLGSSNWNWRYLTRNLLVDLLKGIAISNHAKKLKRRISKAKVRVVSLEFLGRGEISNVSLSNNEHIRHFYDAADWLLKHQDEHGGWPIPVARKVVAGLLEVAPGWYSAMAQGQAISLLVRAAHFSKDLRYLHCAAKATKLLTVNVTDVSELLYDSPLLR